MKHILCFLFGHQPRGPIEGLIYHSVSPELEELVYCCDRCEQNICFHHQSGWITIKLIEFPDKRV